MMSFALQELVPASTSVSNSTSGQSHEALLYVNYYPCASYSVLLLTIDVIGNFRRV